MNAARGLAEGLAPNLIRSCLLHDPTAAGLSYRALFYIAEATFCSTGLQTRRAATAGPGVMSGLAVSRAALYTEARL